MGLPYSEPALHTTQTGGTPYGASHVTGNRHQLSDEEGHLARQSGKQLATLARQLKESK